MREIKFRAFYNGKMYEVENWMFKVGMNWVIVEDESVEKIPAESIMQYTGLKDANGKEIYEGDIVVEAYKGEFSICLTTFEKKPLKSGTYEVKWNKIGFNLGSEDGRDYEVIGNIYENPELLESNGQVK